MKAMKTFHDVQQFSQTAYIIVYMGKRLDIELMEDWTISNLWCWLDVSSWII